MSFTDLEVRVDPDTGKKRRGRPPKPRADGTLPPPKRRVILGADGRPMPRGSNPIDPTTGMCTCTPAPTCPTSTSCTWSALLSVPVESYRSAEHGIKMFELRFFKCSVNPKIGS